MSKSTQLLPAAFRIDVQGDKVRISALAQSPRGTRFIAATKELERKGKTKKEFDQSVEQAIFELCPNYPKAE